LACDRVTQPAATNAKSNPPENNFMGNRDTVIFIVRRKTNCNSSRSFAEPGG
jgi:hypothetical protein